MDYFQVLQLAPGGDARGDQEGLLPREPHLPPRPLLPPDRRATQDGNINDIYKRVTEAYYVLKDDAKRQKYLADITGPDRASKLRYTEASESPSSRPRRRRQRGRADRHQPQGARLLQDGGEGLRGAATGPAAERNLKMALTYEPSNAKYKEKLAEVQKKLDEQRKGRQELHDQVTLRSRRARPRAVRGALRRLGGLRRSPPGGDSWCAVRGVLSGGRPLGTLVGPVVAKRVGCGSSSGVVLATVSAFLLVFLVVQVVRDAGAAPGAGGEGPEQPHAPTGRSASCSAATRWRPCRLRGALRGDLRGEQRHLRRAPPRASRPRTRSFVAGAPVQPLRALQQFSGVKDLVRWRSWCENPTNAEQLKDDPDLVSRSRRTRASSRRSTPTACARRSSRATCTRCCAATSVLELIQDPAAGAAARAPRRTASRAVVRNAARVP